MYEVVYNRSLADADDSVDGLYGVLCALMPALPEAVVLQNNGYCHNAALHTLCLSDLKEMGVLRGHARMIMSVLRPGGGLPHTTVASSPRNETSIETPRPAGRYVRCRSFREATSGSAPARRAWRAFMLACVVVLRTIGLPPPVPDIALGVGLRPSNAHASVDADVSGLV